MRAPDYSRPHLPDPFRLWAVAAIVRLWRIMPLRARAWAFLNDDMPDGGAS